MKSKCLIILWLLIGGLLQSQNTTDSKTLTAAANSPIFNIKVETFSVSYAIVLNGKTIIEQHEDDLDFDRQFKINSAIQQGNNNLDVIIFPQEEGDPYNSIRHLRVILLATEKNTNTITNITDINFNAQALQSGNGLIGHDSNTGFNSIGKIQLNDQKDTILVNEITYKLPDGYDEAIQYSRKLNIPATLLK